MRKVLFKFHTLTFGGALYLALLPSTVVPQDKGKTEAALPAMRDSNSWKIVTNMTVTSPPIRILASKSSGWHNIGVWVQGGGVQPGYEAELRFDGKTYPRNPSVPPARRLEGNPAGEVVISSAQNARPLYDAPPNATPKPRRNSPH
jgi:hypothetical protein